MGEFGVFLMWLGLNLRRMGFVWENVFWSCCVECSTGWMRSTKKKLLLGVFPELNQILL